MANRPPAKNHPAPAKRSSTERDSASPVVARPSFSESTMNQTRNDLPQKTRAGASELLNARLADLLDLHSQVKQAHWNIKGPGFYSLHELLDELAGVVIAHTDEVAERAVQLGAFARGTIRMAAAASTLPEYPDKLAAQQRTLQTVADRLAAVAKSVREAIDATDEMGDADTADLFTGVSRSIDKYLWFIESHLHPGG